MPVHLFIPSNLPLLATLAAMCLVSVGASKMAQNPIPGIMQGVGSSFDVTKLTALGLDVKPMQPVIELTYCEDNCLYPENQTTNECLGCTYSLPNYPDMFYKVPQQVEPIRYESSSTCYEHQTSATVKDYTSVLGTTIIHSGFFNSWSKTTLDFYHEYYKTDSSMSLMYQADIWHSLILPSFMSKPSGLFTLAVESLPQTYDSQIYLEFIQQYGTHFMDRAHVGGMALMTDYFHSCFIQQYGGQYIYHEDWGSFFGIVSWGSKNRRGFNHTSQKFLQWSNPSLKLLGGNAAQYGTFDRKNTMSAAQVDEWTDSIKSDMTIISYSLQPLWKLITDPAIVANMKTALTAYGATVAASNAALVQKLVPQDPNIKPAWCHYSVHPPPGTVNMSPRRRPGRRRLDSNMGTLPGCPSLP